jgi:hypothetical protein
MVVTKDFEILYLPRLKVHFWESSSAPSSGVTQTGAKGPTD